MSKTYLILCLPLLLFGCVRNPATRKVHAKLLSPEAELRIGESTKKQILEQYRVFESTTVSTYVNRVGQKLAQVCDRPTVNYDFTILDSDLINAFAVPGGFIFVTRGLLENINDEAELAMVLGHEIGHVAALHGVQMIQKEMGQNALTVLGTIGAALVAGPEAMLMVANTASLFSSLYLLGYSRDKELEADNLGLQYMLRAGYDPQASLRFLKELQKSDTDESKGWDLYFRTHPKTSERIDIIEGMIGLEKEDLAKAHVQEYQAIKSLLPRTSAEELGKIDGQVYRNALYALSIKVPTNWILDRFQPQSLISFHTQNNEGEGRLQIVDLSSETTTAQAMALQYGKYSGFQFQSGRDILHQAGYGYLGRFYGVSPTGKLLDIRLFATIRRGHGFIFMCGAPPEKSDSYSLDLEQIIRSLKFSS